MSEADPALDWRYARQRLVPEIGLEGQRRLMGRHVALRTARPGAEPDPLAASVARRYLERAGVRLATQPDGTALPLDLPARTELLAWAGTAEPALRQVAAMLAGALSATEAIARLLELDAPRPAWREHPCPTAAERTDVERGRKPLAEPIVPGAPLVPRVPGAARSERARSDERRRTSSGTSSEERGRKPLRDVPGARGDRR